MANPIYILVLEGEPRIMVAAPKPILIHLAVG